MEKKVVFISASKYDVVAQLSRIREYQQKSDWQIVVVAVGYGAQRMCENHSLPFKTTMDYLTTEKQHRVSVEALRFAKGWYKSPEIEKILCHKGISLCEVMDYDFYLFFSGLFLDIELYQGIFEIERPDKIVMIEMTSPEQVGQNVTTIEGYASFIVSSLTEERRISVEWIAPIQRDSKHAQKGAGLKEHILHRTLNFVKVALLLDRHAKIRHRFQQLWHFCFSSLTATRPLSVFVRKKRKIAFFEGLGRVTKVADYLRKDPSNGVVCLKGPGKKQRAMNIVPQIYLESFSTSEINAIVEEKRRDFTGIFEQSEIVDYLENKFCYKSLNFWPIMRKKLEYSLSDSFPLMVRGMELTKEMVNRVGLDLCISTSDQNPIIRAMTKALQLEGRKTLLYHHGLDYFSPIASEVFGKCVTPIVADKIATWGDASRGWFISQGTPADRIEATSCSDFDDYIRILKYSKKSIRHFTKIPAEKKVILYAMEHGNPGSVHPYYAETRDEVIQHLREVIEEIANFPDLYLIVRPHPGDGHPEEIEQIVHDQGGANIMFNPKFPLPYLLRASDILLTYSSSAALEAMIFNNNILVYNPMGKPELVPYVRDGAALRVVKKEDIIPTILGVLENDSLRAELAKKRENFVRYCAGPIDGNATRKIANIILKMIDDKAVKENK